ncbi:MAG: hypothetical protein ACREP7_14920 [Lysobacter sp.]
MVIHTLAKAASLDQWSEMIGDFGLRAASDRMASTHALDGQPTELSLKLPGISQQIAFL